MWFHVLVIPAPRTSGRRIASLDCFLTDQAYCMLGIEGGDNGKKLRCGHCFQGLHSHDQGR